MRGPQQWGQSPDLESSSSSSSTTVRPPLNTSSSSSIRAEGLRGVRSSTTHTTRLTARQARVILTLNAWQARVLSAPPKTPPQRLKHLLQTMHYEEEQGPAALCQLP